VGGLRFLQGLNDHPMEVRERKEDGEKKGGEGTGEATRSKNDVCEREKTGPGKEREKHHRPCLLPLKKKKDINEQGGKS